MSTIDKLKRDSGYIIAAFILGGAFWVCMFLLVIDIRPADVKASVDTLDGKLEARSERLTQMERDVFLIRQQLTRCLSEE